VFVCNIIYPSRYAHAPYYTAISVLSGSNIFFHIIPQTAREGEAIEHKLCVLIFSTTL